jgi:hypothetical protein
MAVLRPARIRKGAGQAPLDRNAQHGPTRCLVAHVGTVQRRTRALQRESRSDPATFAAVRLTHQPARVNEGGLCPRRLSDPWCIPVIREEVVVMGKPRSLSRRRARHSRPPRHPRAPSPRPAAPSGRAELQLPHGPSEQHSRAALFSGRVLSTRPKCWRHTRRVAGGSMHGAVNGTLPE